MITPDSIFPFGKYAGTKFKDLPTTYIVYALDTFKLEDDYKNVLLFLLCKKYDLLPSDEIKKWLENITSERTFDKFYNSFKIQESNWQDRIIKP